MKLYYSPGACSLASRIVLHELGMSYEAVRVDLKAKVTEAGADFSAINPKGYVPALVLDNGELLTEGTAILQYLADQKPAAGLAPPPGDFARYRLQEWLGFINSEVHKNFGPLFNPTLPEASRAAAKQNLARRLEYVASVLATRDYLTGQFSVADAYLYVTLGWSGRVGVDLSQWPALQAYHARVGERPAVKAARAAEGLG